MSDVFASLRDGTSADCLSDLTLDCLRNNELPPAEQARAQSHLQSCVRCQEKQLALQHPPLPAAELPLLAARTRRAAEAGAAVRIAKRYAPLAIAACLTAVVAALVLKPAAPSFQVKGGDSLTLVVKRRGGQIERVTEGATLFASEQVRFSVDLKAAASVLVLSLDAAGKVSLFTPEPLPLKQGVEQLLETTVELDASEGAERFLVVACDQPKPTTELITGAEQALRQANNKPERVVSINSGCRETSLLMHKLP